MLHRKGGNYKENITICNASDSFTFVLKKSCVRMNGVVLYSPEVNGVVLYSPGAKSKTMMHTGRRGNRSGGADGITENRRLETKNRYLRRFPTRENYLVFFVLSKAKTLIAEIHLLYVRPQLSTGSLEIRNFA